MNKIKTHEFTAAFAKKIILVFCALAIFLFIVCLHQITPFIYQTNDDLFLNEIVSGQVTGTPEARLYHIGYPVGLVLSGLYKIFPSLPWYGLFLSFSIGLSLFVVLAKLLMMDNAFTTHKVSDGNAAKFLFGKFLTACLFLFGCYCFLAFHLIQLQFTTVTTIVSAAAIFLFACGKISDDLLKTLRDNLAFLLLSAYAFCIRDNGFLMMLPFLGMIGLGKYLDITKKQRQNLLLLGLLFCVLVAALFGINKIAYGNDAWRSFQKYNTARKNIYDYSGYPDYDSHAELYESLGISRSSYEAASHHYNIILDPHINLESFTALEQFSGQNDESVSPMEKLQDMFSFFIERSLSLADYPLNRLVYCCYFLFLLLALWGRKWLAVRDIFFLLFARMVIWTYLLYFGRLPLRISQGIYIAELFLLLALCFGRKLWEKSRLCWLTAISLLMLLSIRSGLPNTQKAVADAKARITFSESYKEIRNYFASHPDNFYYLDVTSFSYFTQDALDGGENACQNYLLMGGWLANSPWYEAKFTQEEITDIAASLIDENTPVYAVFMKSADTGWEYLEDFYAEAYPGTHLEIVEEFSTSGGITFEILKGK